MEAIRFNILIIHGLIILTSVSNDHECNLLLVALLPWLSADGNSTLPIIWSFKPKTGMFLPMRSFQIGNRFSWIHPKGMLMMDIVGFKILLV